MSRKARVAVLASGNGSNLQALIDAAKDSQYPADIVVVGTNVSTARAVERARAAGIPVETLEHGKFPNRDAFESAWVEALARHGVEWVCLAGFMRLLGKTFLKQFGGKTLNIHPSLLPAFPGLHAQRQALEYGVKVSGCTVHLVDEGCDTGPILGQAAVPVLEGDTEETLSARIHKEEHILYPKVLRLLCEGRISFTHRRSQHGVLPLWAEGSLRHPGEG